MSQMKKIHLGAAPWGVLVGLGLALAIAACASQARGIAGMDERKQDIQRLWNEIRQMRKDNGMSADPTLDPKRSDILQNSVPKIRQCPDDDAPKSDQCADVCTLKDDICDNAASICRIAGELGDDDWARDKCNKAKASCKEATEKCCTCESADTRSESADTGSIEQDEAKTGGAIH